EMTTSESTLKGCWIEAADHGDVQQLVPFVLGDARQVEGCKVGQRHHVAEPEDGLEAERFELVAEAPAVDLIKRAVHPLHHAVGVAGIEEVEDRLLPVPYHPRHGPEEASEVAGHLPVPFLECRFC